MRAETITRVEACDLRLTGQPWPFAVKNATAIEAHWQARHRANPGYFNGEIHAMHGDGAITNGVFSASFLRTDFKSFLYWRETGYPAAGAFDAFGSAIIRSAEGHILLGRQSGGNINAGLAYPPGGFIDARDAMGDGAIDIAGSIARELAEETGLDVATLTCKPGFLVTRIWPLVSIGQEFVASQPADELRAGILARISADPDPELTDIVIVRQRSDLNGLSVPPYAELIVKSLLDT